MARDRQIDAMVDDGEEFMTRYMPFIEHVLTTEPIDIFAWPTFLPVPHCGMNILAGLTEKSAILANRCQSDCDRPLRDPIHGWPSLSFSFPHEHN